MVAFYGGEEYRLDMKTLIITPLEQELDFFLQSCTRRGFQSTHAALGKLPVARFPGLDLTLACGGIGKAQFALQTQHLLDVGARWDLVICAGAAGALADHVSIGDVVVATVTVEHDWNNRFSQRPAPSFEGAPDAIAGLQRVAPASAAFATHFGPVASGDEDVTDLERRRTLHRSTGALAVAWEGAGGARACRFSNVPFLEIRGVTDVADTRAPSDFETHLEHAMDNVAHLIIAWINPGVQAGRTTA